MYVYIYEYYVWLEGQKVFERNLVRCDDSDCERSSIEIAISLYTYT